MENLRFDQSHTLIAQVTRKFDPRGLFSLTFTQTSLRSDPSAQQRQGDTESSFGSSDLVGCVASDVILWIFLSNTFVYSVETDEFSVVPFLPLGLFVFPSLVRAAEKCACFYRLWNYFPRWQILLFESLDCFQHCRLYSIIIEFNSVLFIQCLLQ